MKKAIMTVCLGMSFPVVAAAGDFSAGAAAGILNGNAKELVYNTADGSKLSELKWKTDNAPVIRAYIDWAPLDYLTLNARGWTTLSSSGAGMDDYDWLITGQSDWSHWSSHPDTHLSYANEFDISAVLWLLKTPDYISARPGLSVCSGIKTGRLLTQERKIPHRKMGLRML